MITFIMQIRKRPELPRDEFVAYYEARHIELVGRLVGARPKSYRRYYAATDTSLVQRLADGRGDQLITDVAAITELTFESRTDAEAMVERMLADDVLPAILADERQFIDEGGISWFLATRH